MGFADEDKNDSDNSDILDPSGIVFRACRYCGREVPKSCHSGHEKFCDDNPSSPFNPSNPRGYRKRAAASPHVTSPHVAWTPLDSSPPKFDSPKFEFPKFDSPKPERRFCSCPANSPERGSHHSPLCPMYRTTQPLPRHRMIDDPVRAFNDPVHYDPVHDFP